MDMGGKELRSSYLNGLPSRDSSFSKAKFRAVSNGSGFSIFSSGFSNFLPYGLLIQKNCSPSTKTAIVQRVFFSVNV